VSHEQKLSVLEKLLARVQQRAAAPRVAAPAPAQVAAVAPPAAFVPTPQPKEPAPPALELATLTPAPEPPAPVQEAPALQALGRDDVVSEPPDEEGPPSAPRLREAAALDAAGAEEQEPEEEIELKTPPPESGRQQVAPAVDLEPPSDASEMDISITVSDSVPPPAVSTPVPGAPSESARAPASLSDLGREVSGSDQLDLVPESGVLAPPGAPPVLEPKPASVRGSELSWPPAGPSEPPEAPTTPHMTRPGALGSQLAEPPTPPTAELEPSKVEPAKVEPAKVEPSMVEPAEIELAVALPTSRAPSAAPAQSTARAASPEPAAGTAEAPSAATPARLMAQSLAEPSGPAAAPVEVWASTHAGPALRGQVATFVGQNVAFAPKSFGELLDASLELGSE
jgi:hypothetical protein